jgi:hypothetical protein
MIDSGVEMAGTGATRDACNSPISHMREVVSEPPGRITAALMRRASRHSGRFQSANAVRENEISESETDNDDKLFLPSRRQQHIADYEAEADVDE